MDGIEEFKGAMRAHGLNPPEIIEPGKLHRFPTNGKRHDDAGWCKLFADGGGGVFGDFRSGRSETWQAKREKPFTSAEGEAFRQRCKAGAREAEEARRHADAREKAAENLAAATENPATHPYAIKKRVPFGPLLKRGAWSQRGWTDALLVPIYGGDGCLWSIEAINSDGGKDFLAGGRINGGFHPFGKIRGADHVLLGEGLANVAVCVAAEPLPAAAGLSASNLKAVALAVRELAPEADIILLADNDVEPDGGNSGLKVAMEAALAVGGRVAVPGLGGRKCDFWDLWHERGVEAVQRAIAGAKAPVGDAAQEPEDAGSDSQRRGDSETNEQAVARLASMKPMDYDRIRQSEAEALGVRVATLDAEVAKARAALNPGDDAALQGQAIAIDEPDPWPDDVDGAEVLNDTADALTMYLALPDGAADVMALWVGHAHCHTAFLHSPRLNITAPEKGCGKTLTLDVLYWLVPKAIRTEGITTAMLFRLVDKYAPTLLVDEYDAFIHDNEELRGALNAGHKRGGMHLRCEGDKNEVRGFRTFAPVALAGIRDLPGALADRSIVIHMQRIAPTEQREPFDSRRTNRERDLCRKLARWTRHKFQDLESADPELPEDVFNRVADNWRPLFALAEAAGGDWPKRARRAFDLLGKPGDEVVSRSVLLLGDFRDLFHKHGGRLPSADLAGYLAQMEERPWPEYRRGKPITPKQIAALLRPFKIIPKSIRLPNGTPKGYLLDQFTDSFRRYLPPPSTEDPLRIGHTATM